MNSSDRSIVKDLRERESELLASLHKVQLALEAYDATPRGAASTARRTPKSHRKRPREVEAEVRRVLTELGRPAVAREILELSTLDCTGGGIFSAAERMTDVESAGKQRYKSRHPATAFKLKSMRVRPGEGVVDD